MSVPSLYTTRAPTYAIRTTSRYCRTNATKNSAGVGTNASSSARASVFANVRGTALAEASAAISAFLGGVGTTTVNRRIQTATHERPTPPKSPGPTWMGA